MQKGKKQNKIRFTLITLSGKVTSSYHHITAEKDSLDFDFIIGQA